MTIRDEIVDHLKDLKALELQKDKASVMIW
jgi:hypothetical protein